MVYITHIRLGPPATRHEHITRVSWTDPSTGESKSSSTEQMVTWIEGGGDARVQVGGNEVSVRVVTPASGPPHLRTRADGVWSNNLLALPRF